MKRCLQVLMGLWLLVTASVVFADVPDPMVMLKSVSNQLLTTMQQNRDKMKADPKYVNQLVRQILLPHVDETKMAQSVLGRQAWFAATLAQQQAFTAEFMTVVVNTYASALNAYTDQTIRFLPIRGGYEGKTDLTVQSQVIRQDGPPVALDYRLSYMAANSTWEVYDMNVEGISLLESFRAQFATKLSSGSSVADLITFLQQRNNGKNGQSS